MQHPSPREFTITMLIIFAALGFWLVIAVALGSAIVTIGNRL